MLAFQHSRGLSPELRVFATLLAERRGRYDVEVIQQAGPGAAAFGAQALVDVEQIDFRVPDPGLPALFRKPWTAYSRYLAPRRAARVAAGRHFEAVYSSQGRWDIVCAARVARMARVPRIVHLHYNPGPWLGKDASRHLLDADYVVAVSDHIGRLAEQAGVAPHKIITIPNSLTETPIENTPEARQRARQALGLAPDALVVGMNGRIAPYKGTEDLLDAFAGVASLVPSSVLVFVGDGPSLESLKRRAAPLGLADRVKFAGWRSDARELLPAYDVFAHPSYQEPFGLSVLEASAAGLPVVAYRDGATPEIVVDGETGLLAEPGNIEALRASLLSLLGKPEMRMRLGLGGQARVADRFMPAAAGDAFASLIERL